MPLKKPLSCKGGRTLETSQEMWCRAKTAVSSVQLTPFDDAPKMWHVFLSFLLHVMCLVVRQLVVCYHHTYAVMWHGKLLVVTVCVPRIFLAIDSQCPYRTGKDGLHVFHSVSVKCVANGLKSCGAGLTGCFWILTKSSSDEFIRMSLFLLSYSAWTIWLVTVIFILWLVHFLVLIV